MLNSSTSIYILQDDNKNMSVINKIKKYDTSPNTILVRYICQCLFTCMCILCLIQCPYTKVEESFNIQASYDLLYNGYNYHQNHNQNATTTNNTTTAPTTTITKTKTTYDHLQYPGVVPRTFTGPIVLTSIIQLIIYPIEYIIIGIINRFLLLYNTIISLSTNNDNSITSIIEELNYYKYNIIKNYIDPEIIQLLVRGVFMIVTLLFGWYPFINSIDQLVLARQQSESVTDNDNDNTDDDKKTNNNTYYSWIGTYIYLINSCQFHIPYYSSRLLPNNFALLFMLRSYTHWIRADTIIISSKQKQQLDSSIDATTSLSRIKTMKQKQIQLEKNIQLEMFYSLFDMLLGFFIFRCDILLLVVPTVLLWLCTYRITILQCIRTTIFVLCTIVPLSILYDTYLWNPSFSFSSLKNNNWTWPEAIVFYFNVIENKSSQWGIMVWYWYFTNALPKLLLLTIVFIPLSLFSIQINKINNNSTNNRSSNVLLPSNVMVAFDWNTIQYFIPAISFVILYSKLGHKEVRFLFPVMPLFNYISAIGLSKLHTLLLGSTNDNNDDTTVTNDSAAVIKDNPKGLTIIKKHQQSTLTTVVRYILFTVLLLGTVGISFLASCSFIAVSKHNYPGGYALRHLVNTVVATTTGSTSTSTNTLSVSKSTSSTSTKTTTIRVYIDNAAAMSGITLFGQQSAIYRTQNNNNNIEWIFDKAGYEDENNCIIQQEEQQKEEQSSTTTVLFDTLYQRNYTFLIMDSKDATLFLQQNTNKNYQQKQQQYRILHIESGYPHLNIRKVRIQTYPAITILVRE